MLEEKVVQSTNGRYAEKQDYSLPIANTSAVSFGLGLLPTIPFVIAFSLLWGWPWQPMENFVVALGLFWLALLGGVVVHELLHALTWMVAGRKPLRTMAFGVKWRTFTPYAHCREPMAAWAYRLGVAMPALILGIVPMLAGLATANGWLLFFGILFTIAAGGDFLVLWSLRGVNGRSQVADHPQNAGCIVYAE